MYISRDVVFDEDVFPFASLHNNAGARLREEISLLPPSLLNIPSSGDTSTRSNAPDILPHEPANPSTSLQDQTNEFAAQNQDFIPSRLSTEHDADLIPASVREAGRSAPDHALCHQRICQAPMAHRQLTRCPLAARHAQQQLRDLLCPAPLHHPAHMDRMRTLEIRRDPLRTAHPRALMRNRSQLCLPRLLLSFHHGQ